MADVGPYVLAAVVIGGLAYAGSAYARSTKRRDRIAARRARARAEREDRRNNLIADTAGEAPVCEASGVPYGWSASGYPCPVPAGFKFDKVLVMESVKNTDPRIPKGKKAGFAACNIFGGGIEAAGQLTGSRPLQVCSNMMYKVKLPLFIEDMNKKCAQCACGKCAAGDQRACASCSGAVPQ